MQYKLSYYTIFTDPFEVDTNSNFKKQIGFSTRTAQAFILTEEICRILIDQKFDALPTDVLKQLLNYKFIVESEEDELSTIISENKQNIDNENLLYYVIQPTAFCQLGCDYCGQEHKKKNMTSQVQTGVVERIRAQIIPGKYNQLRIGWFGGEPLIGLKEIRELTPHLKLLAREHDMLYTSKVVTNGLSLKENIFLELVDELSINHIEVTLDGIAEFHDNRRYTKQLSLTFDIIFQNLKAIINRPDFQEKKCDISIRCNVDERNYGGVSPLIKLLAENGFAEKISYFYPIGVYSWGNDAHKKSLTKEEFAEKEIDWLMEMYSYGFKPHLLPGRVKSVCLAVSNTSEMIDAYGNIFNCTEVSYVPAYYGTDYKLGNIKEPADTYSSTRAFSSWNENILNGGFPCTTCKMLPVCGGACPKSWSEGRRACPPNKFNIKEKLILSYLSTMENFQELLHEVV